jgi:hypothetical protein
VPLTSHTAGRALTEQEALNAIAFGIARARSTDFYVTDAKGATLALSVTNASKAVPAAISGMAFWCASDFRWRLDVAADLTDGAYTRAYDVVSLALNPDNLPSTLQAVLASGSDTLYVSWLYGT